MEAKSFKRNLKIFKELHTQNPYFLEKLAALETDFRNLQPKDADFEKKLLALSERLDKLNEQSEDFIAKWAFGGTSDNATLERNLSVYKPLWDWWLKTRDERTDWNKYFLSLLFVSTLVAILTPLLTTTGIVALTPLVILLLVAVLTGAIAISLVWALKLWVLWRVERSQRTTLRIMEKALKLPFGTVKAFNGILTESMSARSRRLLNVNYYGLPLIMAGIFILVLIAIGVSLHFGIIPFYNATANSTLNNATIVNATIENSTIHNSTIFNSTIFNATSAPP
jgi:hypothetical protein